MRNIGPEESTGIAAATAGTAEATWSPVTAQSRAWQKSKSRCTTTRPTLRRCGRVGLSLSRGGQLDGHVGRRLGRCCTCVDVWGCVVVVRGAIGLLLARGLGAYGRGADVRVNMRGLDQAQRRA
eukprot:364212-Chlamydomonas_euryale.AAC.2